MSRRSFGIVFAVSLAIQIGNNGLFSVMPAIGRSIGIPDPMVAAVFSLSAVCWASTAGFWARASDRRGRKPLILLGLSGFLISNILCGIVVHAGLSHWAAPMVIFGFFLVARALFGLIGSAVNPASQAYVADHTPREKRTQAMASLAGAVGLGTVIGPFLTPLLIAPGLGLATPLFVFAMIAAAAAFMVWRYLPEEAPRDPAVTVKPAAGAARPRSIWRDGRAAPFLIFGFVVAACQAAQNQTLGFLIIDKLGVSPTAAQGFIAIAMMFGAVAGMLAQWGLIRMFDMKPRQLLRWGAGLAAVGCVIVGLSPDYWTVVAGFALTSLGFGFSRPGFTAGASIAVESHEQGRVAGAIGVVIGVNAIFAPPFVWLYQAHHRAPFFLLAAILVVTLVYTLVNRTLRTGPDKTKLDDATIATLERADEGGG